MPDLHSQVQSGGCRDPLVASTYWGGWEARRLSSPQGICMTRKIQALRRKIYTVLLHTAGGERHEPAYSASF